MIYQYVVIYSVFTLILNILIAVALSEINHQGLANFEMFMLIMKISLILTHFVRILSGWL